MIDLTQEERNNLIRITQSCLVKKNGYFVYTLRKKHYKRSRVLMQLHLNKRLEIWEIVHHKDENKENDDISNLEVLDTSIHTSHHHAGVRRANKSKRLENTLNSACNSPKIKGNKEDKGLSIKESVRGKN